MKIAIVGLAALTLSAPAAAIDHVADTAALERISQALLDSIAPGDPRLYATYLDSALLYVDENNQVRDKPTFLAELFFAPCSPRIRRVFLRSASGAISGFADRREGEDAIWKRIG